jgi:hypothetical protein
MYLMQTEKIKQYYFGFSNKEKTERIVKFLRKNPEKRIEKSIKTLEILKKMELSEERINSFKNTFNYSLGHAEYHI